ncbi:hypothetical protein [Mycolicibacterium setense]|uniref:hypothetical protein n=1 Tax=Mycolicibacterium setense TaxID=431269 RepID=UPI000574A130|nr:hypothetical protein [Mycolicibacterium setense]KHO22983.1 hypothetical protein QQ25_07015 [Mycolicibacterium setense]MCV7115532.1 hypothetical protein [Mycolicibacterium setense]
MPLVLTQNEKSAAAITYDDRLGTSYEFPRRYQKFVQPGESFVYYRGKRSATGSIQVPHYFGTGVVGAVTPTDDGRLRCAITNYRPFAATVPLKQDDRYMEPGADGRLPKEVGLHFRTGVRTIDQKAFDAIVAVGLGRKATKKAASKRMVKKTVSQSAKTAKDEVHDLAVKLATSEAKAQWPSAKIFLAPTGQYFSLIVRHPNGETHHVAVKSTVDDEPRIRLSDGEIAYAEARAAAYSLWVFYGVDLEARTSKLIKRKGRITDDDIDLRAAVQGGRLKNVKSAKTVGPIPG